MHACIHICIRNPKMIDIFCCDKNCQMFKGFSIFVATAQVNEWSARKVFNRDQWKMYTQFTAISSHGMPTGAAGRKDGLCKCKSNHTLPIIESRSLRPCLEGTLSLPRPCSHSDTSGSSSATLYFISLSASRSIPSSSVN